MSVKVIVIKGKPIDQIVLTSDVTTIGRKSDCDISIKDPAVSGSHAQIQKIGDNYLIQDSGSTNGVHVRGRQVKQHVLKNEDVVVIGEHQLKFLISDAGSALASLSDKRENTKVPRQQAAPEFHLQVISGQKVGEKISLAEGLTTIGQAGIQIAAVSKRPQGHFIIHVDGGKNKDRVPLVNGQPTGFKSRKLEVGDKIEVAGIQMEYHAN